MTSRTHALLGTAALAALMACAPAALGQQNARATCHGFPVTTTADRGDITGTARRDVIRLRGPAHVRSGAGDDIICGSRFADRVEAGPGQDVVLGGAGPDHIYGGAGRDTLVGEAGDDMLVGGPGGDTLMGGAGKNRVVRQGARRQAQHGIAPSLADTVVQGTRAVVITTDVQSLQFLMQGGSGFVFNWTGTGPTTGGLDVAWDVAQPLMTTLVPVQGGMGAFVTIPGAVNPVVGERLVIAAQVRGMWGETWSFEPDGVLNPQGLQGPPGSATVTNNTPSPVMAGITVDDNPALAATTFPFAASAFAQPTSLQVRISPSSLVVPGTFLTPLVPGAPGGPSTTVPMPPGGGVAALRYSVNAGFITG